ncbi:MAG: hypothetical protein QXM96_02730 [Candidatus Woesearchaeota archaeon]
MVKKLTIYSALWPFLHKPKEKIHLNELARELSMNHTSLRLRLNELEKKAILKKETRGKLSLYYLNFNNPVLFYYLVNSENEKLIYFSEKWLRLKELISFFNEQNETNLVLIFGSASKDFDQAEDIDILYIGNIDKNNLDLIKKRYNLELHLIQVKNLEDISITLKEEIIKKHLIIKGADLFLRWFLW